MSWTGLIFWCIMPLAQSQSYGVWHCHHIRLSLFLSCWFSVLCDNWRIGKTRWWSAIPACSPLIKELQSCLRRLFLAVTKMRSLPCGCCEGILWVMDSVCWTPAPSETIWADGLSLSFGRLTDAWAFQLVLAWTKHWQQTRVEGSVTFSYLSLQTETILKTRELPWPNPIWQTQIFHV